MIGLFVCSTFTASGPIALRLLGMLPANHTSTLLTILLVSHFLTAALGLTGFIIISSMMADVVEDVAMFTGHRSEGLLFAANGLLNKCINGIGVFLSGLLLAVLHFPQHAVQGLVAPAILRNFALICAPVIATCSLISVALLLFYDIDRSTHQMNVERLE
jgi:glycoside/pentoside/hexuronide:cation symporter, GPH family